MTAGNGDLTRRMNEMCREEYGAAKVPTPGVAVIKQLGHPELGSPWALIGIGECVIDRLNVLMASLEMLFMYLELVGGGVHKSGMMHVCCQVVLLGDQIRTNTAQLL